jgi:hypothetical protein
LDSGRTTPDGVLTSHTDALGTAAAALESVRLPSLYESGVRVQMAQRAAAAASAAAWADPKCTKIEAVGPVLGWPD